jgi:1,2-diacylglycerol 3-alpha-glucosyltransferase
MSRDNNRVASIALVMDCPISSPNGVAVSVELLQRELLRLGHNAWIVAPRASVSTTRIDHALQLSAVKYPFSPGQRVTLPLPWVGFPQCDIVHTHSPFTAGLIGAAYARRRGIPHVSTMHTDWALFAEHLPGLSRVEAHYPAVNRWVRRFLRRCDHVVAPSIATMRAARGLGITAPMSVIVSAVDLERLSSSCGTCNYWPIGTRRLLSVARLGREKSLETVLVALSYLRETLPVHLVIAGEGPDQYRLTCLARKLGVESDVTFAGNLSPRSLGHVYRESEVYLSGSHCETQGLATCEAQALGVPVVVVDKGGVREYVKHEETGYLVPEGDSAAMVYRTIALLTNAPMRADFGEAARAFMGLWSPALMAREMVGMYETALNERNGATLRLPLSASGLRLDDSRSDG